MAYCSNCGKALSDDSRFCDGCGAPVRRAGAGPALTGAGPNVTGQRAAPPAPVPTAAPMVPAPRSTSRGPLFAVVAFIVVAAVAGSVWWWVSSRPMTEDEYKQEATAVLEDLFEPFLSMDEEPEDIEAAREMMASWRDGAGVARKRARGLRPPEKYRDAHEDLLEVTDIVYAVVEAYAEIARDSDSIEEMDEAMYDPDSEFEEVADRAEAAEELVAGLVDALEIDSGPLLEMAY